MGKKSKLLNLLVVPGFFIFSAGFLMLLDTRPYEFAWLLKVMPILCLALFVFANMPGRRLLGVGLLFSGAGDILLELPGGHLFEAGMGAFMLAHLCYAALFIRRPGIAPLRGLVLGIVMVFTLSFGIMIYPFLGPMKLPILVYLGVILLMAASACLGSRTNAAVILGALVFIASDAMIAYTRFVAPINDSGFWIMLTYYTAQALLAFGTLKMTPGR